MFPKITTRLHLGSRDMLRLLSKLRILGPINLKDS
jgi:hypothetical protein